MEQEGKKGNATYTNGYFLPPEADMEDELGPGAGSQSTPASVRRELWRETQQQSVGSIEELCEPCPRRGILCRKSVLLTAIFQTR